MDLLFFTFIAYGISNILIFGSIFEYWREFIGANDDSPKNLGKLFSCFMCLSFWVGALISLLVYSPSSIYFGISFQPLTAFVDACFASGSVWLVHTIQEKLE